jgi:hypothetical protein
MKLYRSSSDIHKARFSTPVKYFISVPSLYLQIAVPVVLSNSPCIHVSAAPTASEVKSMEYVAFFIQIL